MKENLQVYPHLNSTDIDVYLGEMDRDGRYVGFCLQGKPQGAGEWISNFEKNRSVPTFANQF
jgi:hypothetical protein